MVAETLHQEHVAEQPAATQSVPAETPPADIEEGRALLESIEGGGTGEQGTEEQPGTTVTGGEPDEFEEAIRAREARAREEERERLRQERQAEDEQRELEAAEWQKQEKARKAFHDRIAAFDAADSLEYLEKLVDDHGAREGARIYLQSVKSLFNDHHRDSLRLADEAAGPRQAKAFLDGLFSGVEAALPKSVAAEVVSKRDEFNSAKDAVGAIISAARKGYVSEAEATDQAAQKVLSFRRKGEAEGWIKPRGSGPKSDEGVATSGDVPTPQQWDALSTSDRMAARAKDPEIEDKIAAKAYGL